MEPSTRCYCHTCSKFICSNSDKQVCKRLNHDMQNGVTADQLDRPTTFLKAKSNDKQEAQYFFNNISLKCFAQMFQQLSIRYISSNRIISSKMLTHSHFLLTRSQQSRLHWCTEATRILKEPIKPTSDQKHAAGL